MTLPIWPINPSHHFWLPISIQLSPPAFVLLFPLIKSNNLSCRWIIYLQAISFFAKWLLNWTAERMTFTLALNSGSSHCLWDMLSHLYYTSSFFAGPSCPSPSTIPHPHPTQIKWGFSHPLNLPTSLTTDRHRRDDWIIQWTFTFVKFITGRCTASNAL